MEAHKSRHEYSVIEEVIHAATHGVGVLLSIGGLSWMLYLSIEAADPWRIVASSIYGATLISLFLASTVYHSMYASRHRDIFKLLDHCAIYLLIAGSYTPFLLVAMRTDTGWWLFGTVWGIMRSFTAIAGANNTSLAVVDARIEGHNTVIYRNNT